MISTLPTLPTLIANRYDLREQLGAGGMGTVFRAQDRLTGGWVALKRVIIAEKPSTPMTPQDMDSLRLALSNEFRVLASLRHPNIISVKDYGFDAERQPYFTMDILDGGHTIVAASAEQPQAEKIRLLIEALQALAYIHRRGLLHRDLKPSNVLVTHERQVKVLDFGLAAVAADLRDNGGNQGGTLAYMSPELLTGGVPTTTSDLYAMGIIACELLQGRLPFAKTNPAALIEAKLHEPPDVYAIGRKFGVIVQRLLARDPDRRYPSAEEVIEALSEALEQPIPVESIAVRESFLQASQFVGRRQEFGRLSAALRTLVITDKRSTNSADAAGRLWLIGGESGVGKSRLVDELRIQAMVQGALVLHGQGVAGGGQPYQLWREAVRRLVLAADASDLEASILREIVPDIGTLLGRDIPRAAALDGKPGQQRLVHTIAGLIRRSAQPILLVLEDLHWASESLEVLKQLIPITGTLRLMLVGTYRHDERADLPHDLPQMQVITLERLSMPEIASLSAAMIGEAGQSPEVVSFLSRETEGNAFFMVEVLRALAEEAGRLSDIGQTTLPDRVVTGGVQNIIRRRLGRVSEGNRALLKRAAVAGRQIDLPILQGMADRLNTNLEAWLTACANVAILEIKDGQWRFAHDKLRESLLADLPDVERADLHREIAEAITATYPDDEDRAAVLTDHWYAAGEVQRGLESAVVAARVTLAACAPRDALAICQRALGLLPDDMPTVKMNLLRMLGTAHEDLGEILQAQPAYESSVALARDLGEQAAEADALRALGFMVASKRGEFNTGEMLMQQALALDEALGNRTGVLLSRRNLTWIPFVQSDFITARTRYEDILALARQIDDKRMIASSLGSLAVANASLSDYPAALRYFEESLALHHEMGNTAGIITQLTNLGAFLTMTGDFRQARTYIEQGLSMSQELGNRSLEAANLINLGMVTVHLAEYATAIEHYRAGLELFRAQNNRRSTGVALAGIGTAMVRLGDWEGAMDNFQQAVVIFREVNDRQNLVTRLNSMAEYYTLHGDFAQAEACMAEAFPISQALGDKRGLATSLTVRAAAAFEQGDMAAAWADGLEALNIRRDINNRETLDYSLLLLGLMALWEGKHEEARAYLEEAISISRDTGAVDKLVDGFAYLSYYYIAQGEVDAARQCLAQALQSVGTLRPPMSLLYLLVGLAWVADHDGEHQRSAELVGMIEAHQLGKLVTLRRWLDPLRERLPLALPPDDLAAAIERGRAFDFEMEIALLIDSAAGD